jgi:hypothetical protein
METISAIRDLEAAIVKDPKNVNSLLSLKKVSLLYSYCCHPSLIYVDNNHVMLIMTAFTI